MGNVCTYPRNNNSDSFIDDPQENLPSYLKNP